jgi:hypothetical protein
MRVHPAVVFTPLEDSEAVLLHLDTKRYYTLNETGRRIWELTAEGRSATEIARALAGEYEVEVDDALQYTETLLQELTGEHLLQA